MRHVVDSTKPVDRGLAFARAGCPLVAGLTAGQIRGRRVAGPGDGGKRPRPIAYRTGSVWLWSPSFRMRLARCVSAVRELIGIDLSRHRSEPGSANIRARPLPSSQTPFASGLMSGSVSIELCRDKIAVYKLPREIEWATQLPRAPGPAGPGTGKLLRRVLRDQLNAEPS